MTIHTKMHAVMQRVEKVRKDLENKHHNYNYVGHDDVTIALRTAFVEVGIVQTVTILEAMRLEGNALGMRVGIKWTDVEDGSSVDVESYGESQAGGKGGPQPQMVGIALSYAVKCAQLKNFCLVGDDTPDVEEQHGPVQTARGPITSEREVTAGQLMGAVEGAVYGQGDSGWNLSGNGSKQDDPPEETETTPFAQMIAGFGAVESLKRFDQMMKKCVPLLSSLSKEERKELETVALRARKRLTSAEANNETGDSR